MASGVAFASCGCGAPQRCILRPISRCRDAVGCQSIYCLQVFRIAGLHAALQLRTAAAIVLFQQHESVPAVYR